jgi:hypothetical protein
VKNIADLRTLAVALDSKFRGPFGWRFGWDGIIGLIPVAGDAVTNTLSLYIIARAAMLDCPPAILLRMLLNLLVENVVDFIPLVGNLFDFVWKANLMNLRLIEAHLANPQRAQVNSRWVVFLVLVVLLLIFIGTVVGSIFILQWLLTQLQDTYHFRSQG